MRPYLLMAVLTLLLVADRSTRAADGDSVTVKLKDFKFKVKEEAAANFGWNEDEEKLFFYSNGLGETPVKITAGGDYEIIIKASCDSALNERAKFKVSIDGQPLGNETLLTSDDPKEYKLPAKLKAAELKLAIEFTNDVYRENDYDRNFYVHAVTVKKVTGK
jgi:hypothetical protein